MINKNDIFPPNELFEFKTDSPSINHIENRIRFTEQVISYTRHTVRLHQNKKKLLNLERKLKITIFNHNKCDLFNVISDKLDEELEDSIGKQFQNLISI